MLVFEERGKLEYPGAQSDWLLELHVQGDQALFCTAVGHAVKTFVSFLFSPVEPSGNTSAVTGENLVDSLESVCVL